MNTDSEGHPWEERSREEASQALGEGLLSLGRNSGIQIGLDHEQVSIHGLLHLREGKWPQQVQTRGSLALDPGDWVRER